VAVITRIVREESGTVLELALAQSGQTAIGYIIVSVITMQDSAHQRADIA
jgi:hypothetical protein